jgi:hypothetical protein
MTLIPEKEEQYVYFIVPSDFGHQYHLRYGKIENRICQGDTEWLDVRTNNEHNILYRIKKDSAFATLDGAKHKAMSLIEANAVYAKSVLEVSEQLLKFN